MTASDIAYRNRVKARVLKHRHDVSIGLPGDPWVIEHFRKQRDIWAKRQLKKNPNWVPERKNFVKGQVAPNKLTDEQKLVRVEELKEYRKKYWSEPERAAERKIYLKNYRLLNKDSMNKKIRDKKVATPELRLLCNMRKRLSFLFKKNCQNKSTKTMQALGCEMDFFVEYIKGKFTLGMNLDNYGKWHLDHIIPCSLFDFSNPIEVAKCFHYTNLQPLWAIDNLQKSNKIQKVA